VSVDWERVEQAFIQAAVIATNATAVNTRDRAHAKAPVRKVFSGGRQTVRFKTADEIDADRALRQRLGLAPEILATSNAVGRVQAAGLNPKRARSIRGEEFGFARTVTSRNRTARFEPGGKLRTEEPGRDAMGRRRFYSHDLRLLNPANFSELDQELAESRLTARGRYELASRRAISGRISPRTDPSTGLINLVTTERARLGGGLRGTIRIERATADTYPVIKGSLVAGDEEHDYAKYQELGTRHNPAHPFVRPRLPEFREELPRQLTRALGRLGR
jgi:hypothetical protein